MSNGKMSWTLTNDEWLALYKFVKENLPDNGLPNSYHDLNDNEWAVTQLIWNLEKKFIHKDIKF